MLESADSFVFTPQIEQLEEQLLNLQQQSEALANQGQYVLAETCRTNAQQLETQLLLQRQQALQQHQKKQGSEVKKLLREDLTDFQKEWNIRIAQQKEKTDCKKADLAKRQAQESRNEKEILESELPSRGKDSAELLNLRKVEENLAKQLNFKEALLVQKEIKELEKKELRDWEQTRSARINAEMKLLRARHLVESQALDKKTTSQCWQLELERTKAEAQLVLKHSVVRKGLRSQDKKENLVASGEFKSKAMLSPSRSILSPNKGTILSQTRSRILSSFRSQKQISTLTR